ncbi:hypothetical protein L1987_43647 [Smallanthus sonchifolius]|uniref:Uncharacterized protein n=1 Tax=Smallanthus sonchifolius TaxID=185202 RepID=A0ACB9GMC8_9ASTR|nr:hypothetical protein L1987_43647 [Smallanthus sonchifolius]
MEESCVGGNEENVVTDGQTEGSIPKVREVFSKHFKDTTQGKESKKKRGKFSRKKSRGEKSVPPSEHDRPKKRSRDGDDPFDVDRFIFNFNEGSNGSQDGDQVQGSPINFLTPDLNREVVVEDVNHAGAHVDSGPETFSQRIDDEVTFEVSETINLGKVLGADNIDSFEVNLANSIVEEGFQVVNK